MKRAIALVVSGAAVLALAGAALSTREDVWKQLRRPLHIPHISSGSPCPTSRPDPKGDLSRFGFPQPFAGTAWGKGPAYPLFYERKSTDERPTLRYWYREAPSSFSTWGAQKVIWIVSGRYAGPLLVRGRQLDGPYRVRFDGGRVPPLGIRMQAGRPWHGYRQRGSYTRLPAPGCYACQLDGRGFSRLIVFEAKVLANG